MKTSRLALLAFTLTIACLILWAALGTTPEATGPPSLPDGPQAKLAGSRQSAMEGQVTEPSLATERRLGSTRLRLVQVSSGVNLSIPTVQVNDPLLLRQLQLQSEQWVDLKLAPSRLIDMQVSPGWRLSTQMIELNAQSPAEQVVTAEPTNIIALLVKEHSSGQPVEDITLQVVWITAANKLRTESSPRQIHGTNGQFLIDGIPLDEGRFMLEVSSESHHRVVTDWIQTRAGWIHEVSIELQNIRLDSTMVHVVVRDKQTLQPHAGVRVHLFEDGDEGHIVGVTLQDGEPIVQRSFPIVDKQFLRIPTQTTDRFGEAIFEVPSLTEYRATAHVEGYPIALAASFQAAPGQVVNTEILLATPALLSGVLMGPELTPQSMPDYTVNLFGNSLRQYATLDPDGRFSFDALPEGDYVVYVTAPLRWASSIVGKSTPLTKQIHLAAGEQRSITLDLGHTDSPRTVTCATAAAFGSSSWSFVVGMLPTEGEDMTTLDTHFFQTSTATGEAEFGFFGIPDGEWGVLALGQTTDSRDRCLLMATVVIKDGVADRPLILLEEAGAPLIVTGTAEPKGQSATYTVHYPDASYSFREMVSEFLPLNLESGSTQRILGLPEGKLELHNGETVIEVNASRRLEVPLH